jgi:hypothetical protein
MKLRAVRREDGNAHIGLAFGWEIDDPQDAVMRRLPQDCKFAEILV